MGTAPRMVMALLRSWCVLILVNPGHLHSVHGSLGIRAGLPRGRLRFQGLAEVETLCEAVELWQALAGLGDVWTK